MSRVALVLLVLVALAAVVLLTSDPFGLFEGSGERVESEEVEGRDDFESAVLEGATGALPEGAAEPRWIEGERVGLLDLGLGKAILTGLVTGEGQPLFGARIRVVLPASPEAQAVRTRRDGTWEIRGVPAGGPDVRATHPKYIGRTTSVAPFADGAQVAVEPIDLALRRTSTDGMSIKVLDEFGKPMVGARVLVTTMDWGIRVSAPPGMLGQPDVLERRGLTNDRGVATVEALVPETYDVVVKAKGYRMAVQAGVVVTEGRTRHMTFRLLPGVSIRGTVVGPDGAAAAGAYVTGMQLPTFMMSGNVMTGADGRFELDGLREGNYWLMVLHVDLGDGQANPVKSPSTGVEVKLAGAGTLEVAVTDHEGAPVTQYQVRPFQPGPFRYEYSQVFEASGEDGITTVKLPPGNYTLLVKTQGGDLSAETKATLTAGETTKVAVKLPVSRTVEGTVVDPDGQHVAAAEVYVRMGGMPGGPRREQYARTDAEGTFRVTGLPAEMVKLHVEKTGFASVVLELDLSADANPGEQTVRLGRGGTIEGRITRGGETPAANEQVNVFQNWFHPLSTRTDGEGRYRLAGLTPGTWNVSTGKFEFGAGGASKNGLGVEEGGRITVDLDIGVPPGMRSITGVVMQGGEGVAGATITVVDARGYDQVVTTTTDASGAFQADGVQAGDVTVQVATASGIRTSERTTVPEEGDVPAVTIELGGGAFRGRLVMMDGTPVSAAWIQVEVVGAEGWGRIRAQLSSDTEGGFQAAGLDPGTYQVRVTGSEYAGFLSEPFEVADGGTTDLGTFRLESGTTLQGRVTDDAGAPVEDATISLEDDTGRPVYVFSLVTTGSDGRYAVTGIEAGRYRIGFEAKGYAPSSKTIDLGADGATVDGVLSRGGAVEVELQDLAGAPLPGVRVGLLDASGRPVERTLSLVSIFQGEVGRSGEDGKAVIPDLAPGTYTVVVRSGGWTLQGDPPVVRIGAGETTSTRLVLSPQ